MKFPIANVEHNLIEKKQRARLKRVSLSGSPQLACKLALRKTYYTFEFALVEEREF